MSMGESIEKKGTTIPTRSTTLPLHRRVAIPYVWANRAFAIVYSCAILALLYHHFINLTTNIVTISMFVADVVLAVMWVTSQPFRMNPVGREVFPENLARVLKETDYPALDIFICTADPYKEPPMGVVNTALSVMAYEYPTDKLSIYVSDDGGSQLTLFAFMEAAKFATHWIPYCKKNNIEERCPEVYFRSDRIWFADTKNIQLMYENMKNRVENVVERGSVSGDYLISEQELQVFEKWTNTFTRQDHPSVIQVLLESVKDKDVAGQPMPNLVYVSREKSKGTHHHFKAGALNALLRVSATMTNAPIVMNLDCDFYSNNPRTPHCALCFHLDPAMNSNLAFVQFPQLFRGLNKDDTYGSSFKIEFQLNTRGLDGLGGPAFMGTGCFFNRRAFFGGPKKFVAPESSELSPHHVVKKSIQCEEVLAKAHQVSGCKYEIETDWGSEIGFRYGSLVEDLYTGFRLQSQGWKSVFCSPKRAAFYGEAPTTLDGMLTQTKRWAVGLLDLCFSENGTVKTGFKSLNPFWASCYTHYALWPIWSIPITVYAFLPQLALLNSFSVFPKVTDPWFYLYVFLFVGAYGQHFLLFNVSGESVQTWWNSQRVWTIRGLSSFLFGFIEYLLQSLGISTSGFTVTSKVVDSELNKRYEQGIMEFGVESPMFVPVSMASMINLVSLIWGVLVLGQRGLGDIILQVLLACFAVVNSWPLYEAMVLRTDKGKMPIKITLISLVLAWVLYLTSFLVF